eukprot:8580_1
MHSTAHEISFLDTENNEVAKVTIFGAECDKCQQLHLNYDTPEVIDLYQKRIILSSFTATTAHDGDYGTDATELCSCPSGNVCSSYPHYMDALWKIKQHIPHHVKVSSWFHTESTTKLRVIITTLYISQLLLTIYQFFIKKLVQNHTRFLIQSSVSLMVSVIIMAVTFIVLLGLYASKHGRDLFSDGVLRGCFLFVYDDFVAKDRYLVKINIAEQVRVRAFYQYIPKHKYQKILLFIFAFMFVMINLIYAPSLALFYVISMLRIHNGQWVLPEMYDWQQDLSYLVVDPILQNESIHKLNRLWNIESVLYHILNAEVCKTQSLMNGEDDLEYRNECYECIDHDPLSNTTTAMEHCTHEFNFDEFCFKHYDAFCDRNNSRIAKPFYFVTTWDENIGVLVLYLVSMFWRYYNYNADDWSIYCSALIDLFVIVFVMAIVYVYYHYYHTFYKEKTRGIKFWMNEISVHYRYGGVTPALLLYDSIERSMDNMVAYMNRRLCYEMIQYCLVKQYNRNYQIPSYIVDIIVGFAVSDSIVTPSCNYSYNGMTHLDILKDLSDRIQNAVLIPVKQYCDIVGI